MGFRDRRHIPVHNMPVNFFVRVLFKVLFNVLSLTLFIVLFFFSQGNLRATPADSRERFSKIDLTGLPWYGLPDFKSAYVGEGGEFSGLREAKRIQKKFPLVINDIFDIPRGDALRHTTLFTRFQLPQQWIQIESLAIHLGWVGENWAVYLNGKLLRSEIYLDEVGQIDKYRIFRRLTVPIGPRFLRAGENILLFHFVGYAPATFLENNTNHGFLFSEEYSIDSSEALGRRYRGLLNSVLFAVYLFFGLYHILLYGWRLREVYNLNFGLFAIFLAGNIFMSSVYIQELFLDTSWVNRIKYACQAMLGPNFLLFLHYYFFSDRRPGIIDRIGYTYFPLFALGFLILPFRYTEAWLLLFQYSLGPFFVYALWRLGYILYLKKKDGLFITAGVLGLILAGIWDTLDDFLFNTGASLNYYGFLGWVFVVVVLIARRFLLAQREAERLNDELREQKDAFHRFVPTQFLEHLGKKSAMDIRAGDSAEYRMSVLFCDIRSFTSISEAMSADQVFRFLNIYLDVMEPAIEKHRGFVDKYMGDAILALFSSISDASNPRETLNVSADNALRAALEMKRTMAVFPGHDEFAALNVGNNFPPRFGVGINTGGLIMGTLGSKGRIDTTVIGDTVNVAARLESLTRYYGNGILISEDTRNELIAPENFQIREVDRVVLKGKTNSMNLYEVFDDLDEPSIARRNSTRSYLEEGRALLYNRQFEEARRVFTRALHLDEADRVLRMYIRRCDKFLQKAPGPRWDGAYRFRMK